MCGVIAAFEPSGRVDRARFAAAMNAIAHRGPDGEGSELVTLADGGAWTMGHCRLSIFDLSDAGRQPMAGPGGRWISFNGEIFNWPELRAELSALGYSFKTQTDTEVILAAYDKWGPQCVTRFNGFWAFVLFDPKGNDGAPAVFLSRDRFGIKPLFYHLKNGRLVVASEIRAIFEYLGTAPEPDRAVLARELVLHLGEDTAQTIYSGILEIEPASNATFDPRNGRMRIWRYWKPDPENRFTGGEEEAVDRFGALLEESVRIRLRADREVALTLSGGVDSSAIAVAISRTSGAKVRAFTSHFPDHPEIDETRYARQVADACGFEHVLVEPHILDLVQEERALARHQELLYGGLSLLVNWAVIREINRHGIAVFLTGQGGDELFFGYERYFAPYMISRLRKQPLSVFADLSDASRHSRLSLRDAASFLLYFSNTALRKFRYRRDALSVFADEFVAAASGDPHPLAVDPFELLLQEVCGNQLRHLLRFDDRTAAAFGAEGRPAFLDVHMVEFAFSLGWDFKLRNGWTKYITRKYLERAGLPEIAWRKHKLGYNAPTVEWTRKMFAQTGIGDLGTCGGILKPGLTPERVPDRMLFPVYNLLSTSRAMGWQL